MAKTKAKERLEQLKRDAAIANAGTIPIVSEEICETCFSESRAEHPITGLCFICGSDDWYCRNPDYDNKTKRPLIKQPHSY